MRRRRGWCCSGLAAAVPSDVPEIVLRRIPEIKDAWARRCMMAQVPPWRSRGARPPRAVSDSRQHRDRVQRWPQRCVGVPPMQSIKPSLEDRAVIKGLACVEAGLRVLGDR